LQILVKPLFARRRRKKNKMKKNKKNNQALRGEGEGIK
jgi:hypothetical protein